MNIDQDKKGSGSSKKVKDRASQAGPSSTPKTTIMTMGQDSRTVPIAGVDEGVKLQAHSKSGAPTAASKEVTLRETSEKHDTNPEASTKTATHKTSDFGAHFRFKNPDPAAHTMSTCTNETLDPCDYAERVQAFGNRLPPPNGEVQQFSSDENQQVRQTVADLAPIPPLPVPSTEPSESLTTIGTAFPSTFSAGSELTLTPIPAGTANYFRSMGVPSRIYACKSNADPNQDGQFIFNLMPTEAAQGSTTNQQQPRSPFVIINVNNFNFPASGPAINLTQTQNFDSQGGGQKPKGLKTDRPIMLTGVLKHNKK